MEHLPCYKIVNPSILADCPEDDLNTALGLFFAVPDRDYVMNLNNATWLVETFYPEVKIQHGFSKSADPAYQFPTVQLKGPKGTVCFGSNVILDASRALIQALMSISIVF